MRYHFLPIKYLSLVLNSSIKVSRLTVGTSSNVGSLIASNNPDNLIRKSKSIHYFVAVEDDRIIGICGYDRHKVQTLFVDVNFHKMGIGKALLNHVLKEATKAGQTSIDTWATKFSIPFYLKFGFKIVGEVQLPKGKNDIRLIQWKNIKWTK